MLKVCTLSLLAAVMGGCVPRATAWRGDIEWPTESDAELVAPSVEAGTALAAAAAIREMVKRNPYPDLFWGCSSPEQGLNVAVFKSPKTGLYYVVVHQRFDRCGGPRVRVLDGWYAYAVTPQGEVVAEAPLMTGEAPPVSTPIPDPGAGQALPPATPPTEADAETPAPPTSPSPSSLPPPNVGSPATDASKPAFEAPATPTAPVSTPPRPALPSLEAVPATPQER